MTTSIAVADAASGVAPGTIHLTPAGKELIVDPGAMIVLGDQDVTSNAKFMGAGNATTRVTTAVADVHHIDFRFETTATSGDNRGIYNRYYIKGTGGGESLRSATMIVGSTVGTAHGAHFGLDFSGGGKLTGLGVGCRGTLIVPDSTSYGGTCSGLMAEVNAEGTASDCGLGQTSCLQLVVSGNGTGAATHRNWMSLVGANANSVVTGAVGGTAKGIRVLIDGVAHYITCGTTCS